ncbi:MULTISPECIES: flagellar motor switch protein FliG [unclassified Saccharibacter]|uniref:flagellar motor switch protein FliG n=1 Tax=unclassified Saccharibacter TaxID=2648722 RepID=UPI00132BE215|nr:MULTISPECIES: flagellar motor switch protein FliG [unclassified Saccharibacter]MXV36002.1 flagellar motor switch protein FliG [Saccharibacter sp. EH611]MXV56861.1 flagellar motor switch protein FliG [Saccharibacter sp. EH70]MXV66779.1 flagellar motor switch protein FliG [Saccharibacter sp. EH60]
MMAENIEGAVPPSDPVPVPPAVAAEEVKAADSLTGKQKAAILMLAIGQERSSAILKALQEDEVRDISMAMSSLGMVKAETVEAVCHEFSRSSNVSDGLVGGLETTEEYLRRALPAEEVEKIMEDIRGPSGRNVWTKMGNMPETALANYLRGEQPQTVAVILSYIAPSHVARVLTLFPEDFATDIIVRMLHMTPVSRDVLESLETTLRRELISAFGRSTKRDSYAFVAEVYNNFDRKTEASLTERLGERSVDDMEKVNKLKFTFDDIKRLTPDDMMTVVAAINRDGEAKSKMPLALKGANPNIRKLFFDCMSKRSSGILADEISGLGAVRMRDAEAAQMSLISFIKDLANDGEIDLSPSSGDDEIIE